MYELINRDQIRTKLSLFFQLTFDFRNSNICKHISFTLRSEQVFHKIFELFEKKIETKVFL